MPPRNDPLHNSDSDDDDEDYVPPDKEAFDSEESEAEDNNETSVAAPELTEDVESKKRDRDALWAEFQASVATPPKSVEQSQEKMVKIEKKYLFAGKEVVEVVAVPESSPDVKKWPLWRDSTVLTTSTSSSKQALDQNSSTSSVTESSSNVINSAVTAAPSELPSTSGRTSSNLDDAITVAKLPARKPGPRKSKVTLASLPGSSKTKKLTTLDKSALDWRNHMQTEKEAGTSVADELEANRRSGGYLDKVEFLKRVEERKEDNLEAIKSSKRRKL